MTWKTLKQRIIGEGWRPAHKIYVRGKPPLRCDRRKSVVVSDKGGQTASGCLSQHVRWTGQVSCQVRIKKTNANKPLIVLFPDKLEKANEMLRRVGLPKQWLK
ncbi:MAG: hypothetical protein FVQ77_16935 [Cytophagales bacterium]|nr:hypothetical protein [Cytophagales bacterium]